MLCYHHLQRSCYLDLRMLLVVKDNHSPSFDRYLECNLLFETLYYLETEKKRKITLFIAIIIIINTLKGFLIFCLSDFAFMGRHWSLL